MNDNPMSVKRKKIKTLKMNKTILFLKATIYGCITPWSGLIKYIDSRHSPIDNNAAENAIKPFVISRKNCLFAYS